MDKELNRLIHEVSNLTREARHRQMLELERDLDLKLSVGIMDQESAWDAYFGLLHECDESGFMEDRPRILSKIDTEKYNPLESQNPNTLMIVRIILGSGE